MRQPVIQPAARGRSGPIEIRGRWYAPAEVSRVLEPFLSDDRKTRIERVLDHRTYTVTPVVEGVHDMGNASAVMRSAEALGYQSVHVVETADEYRRSPRTTQGADKWLDVYRWPGPSECVSHLRKLGYRIVVTHLEADDRVDDLDFTEPTAIVFGNEARGISPEMLSLADRRCILPMKGFVESFNISVAAAVILYHAYLQRAAGPAGHGDLTDTEKTRLRADFYMKSVKESKAILARLGTALIAALALVFLGLGESAGFGRPPEAQLVPIEPDSARVTYVGNEGFLIEVGDSKVLIDALYRTGVAGYVVHTPELRRQLERALPPYDGVDLVLATHYHADHFDPQSVGSHLINNVGARFISTEQSVSQLETAFPAWRHIQMRVTPTHPPDDAEETFRVDSIRVTALNLHHGQDRPIENLGFLIEIGEWSFLHIGDTEVTPDDLASRGLAARGVDVFFVPYWFLAYSGWDGKLEAAVGSPALVPMHMPPPDDPRGYLSDLGGFAGAVSRIAGKYPAAVILTQDAPVHTFR